MRHAFVYAPFPAPLLETTFTVRATPVFSLDRLRPSIRPYGPEPHNADFHPAAYQIFQPFIRVFADRYVANNLKYDLACLLFSRGSIPDPVYKIGSRLK